MSVFKHKSFQLLVTGILIGLFLGLYTNRCKARINKERILKRSISNTNHNNIKETQRYEQSKLLCIGVLVLNGKFKSHFYGSIFQKNSNTQVDTEVFCVNNSSHCRHLGSNLQSVVLISNERMILAALEYMFEAYLSQYEWFLIANDGVFIDVNKFAFLLSSVNSSKSCYIRNSETKEERTSNTGNTILILSQNGLGELAKYFNKCSLDKLNPTRCIHKYVTNSCLNPRQVRVFPLHYSCSTCLHRWVI